VDADGVFRAVVAHLDPGVANWLDPVGHREGSMIYRWNMADATPVPKVRRVALSDLAAALPADTPRIDAATRACTIEVRREHVRKRFAAPGSMV